MPRSTAFMLNHNHPHRQNRFAVIPISQRLGAPSRYTGKGVTIAFLDSGFYPHPDLTQPDNRIIAFGDVTGRNVLLDAGAPPQAWDWHGTQTSAVAAGNGYLSDGLYRGLASDASLVLVKVSDRGRISDESIARGIEWVIEHRELYHIRVVCMSLGGDVDVSFKESIVDRAAEKAVKAGLVVVVAAGNSGCSENPRPIPPANSPSVITVGGYDDNNRLDNHELDLYCSNFGHTVHYQHVDGTSFAAPIVASIVAQMLEANPNLSPQAIKNILISTADRIADQPLIRQGYGALNPRRAIEQASREEHTHPQCDYGPPRIEANRLVFWFHDDRAESVALAGEFNDWDATRDRLIKQPHGMWRAEIELLAPGSYQYKFVIDHSQWVDDPSNGLKAADNHGGFNSLLNIAE